MVLRQPRALVVRHQRALGLALPARTAPLAAPVRERELPLSAPLRLHAHRGARDAVLYARSGFFSRRLDSANYARASPREHRARAERELDGVAWRAESPVAFVRSRSQAPHGPANEGPALRPLADRVEVRLACQRSWRCKSSMEPTGGNHESKATARG